MIGLFIGPALHSNSNINYVDKKVAAWNNSGGHWFFIHLKNLWMSCTRDEGWRLSPAFDLAQDIGQRGEHVLFFDLDVVYPGRASLVRMGRAWGVSGAKDIIEQVFSAVSHWREEYLICGIEQKDILITQKGSALRVATLNKIVKH